MIERHDHDDSLFGSGLIHNTWPRAGLTETSADGRSLIGRFVSDGDGWRYDDARDGASRCGMGDPLDALQQTLLEQRAMFLRAGALGYVAYEMGFRYLGLEPPDFLPTDSWRTPGMQFLIFEQLSHPFTPPSLTQVSSPRTYTRDELDRLVHSGTVEGWVSKSRYLADVNRIKEHIASGDIYQANYTQTFEVRSTLDADENHCLLSAQIRAPYTAYLNFSACSVTQSDGTTRQFPSMAVMAVSPERFWRARAGLVDSRPIKGTIARGTNALDDRLRRRRLLSSTKDRAELLMITDLVRNDLGQVADIGSVRTDALVRVRPTPTVWHLESTVTAKIASELSWVDVMKALLPAGSISGTPKRRAVEILAALEPVRRGPYCGAIGWVDADGNADFAVGIRTCVQIGDVVRVHGGGGIVADSDPEDEYYESLVKIAPLLEALSSPLTINTRSNESETAQFHA
jgi:anthranilate/para-aminobenzoate synthase component I